MLLFEKPDIVTTKAAAGITAPAVVMTTDVAVVAPHVPVSPATLLLPAATVGVMDGAKKPEGYVSVMVPPAGTRFNAVNPSVTGTDVFPALRSIVEMLKYKSQMGCPNPPECTAADGSKSAEVFTITPALPAVKPPMVKPVTVMMMFADGGIAAPAVVMSTEVAVVAPQVAVKPATLLPPTKTTGVTDGAKKESGYVSVMVPPGLIPPNTDGVKPTVTVTSVLPALRSDAAIMKETASGRVQPTMRPTLRINTHAKTSAKPRFHFEGYVTPIFVDDQCT